MPRDEMCGVHNIILYILLQIRVDFVKTYLKQKMKIKKELKLLINLMFKINTAKPRRPARIGNYQILP